MQGTPYGGWLLIFDNANRPAVIRGQVPTSCNTTGDAIKQRPDLRGVRQQEIDVWGSGI